MTAPDGLAIFGHRQNGILVSEAGVPAVEAVLVGRIFAETDGAVRTRPIVRPGFSPMRYHPSESSRVGYM